MSIVPYDLSSVEEITLTVKSSHGGIRSYTYILADTVLPSKPKHKSDVKPIVVVSQEVILNAFRQIGPMKLTDVAGHFGYLVGSRERGKLSEVVKGMANQGLLIVQDSSRTPRYTIAQNLKAM